MWCEKEEKCIDITGCTEKPKGQKRRCPKCGKHLLVRMFESDAPGCWRVCFPAHKVPKAKRKRKKYKDMNKEV